MLYLFYVFYVFVLGLIWYEDYKYHLIKLYTFYLFVLANIVFYYYLFGDWLITSVLILGFLMIFVMDLWEIFVWEIKTIWKYWRIWWMWVYDLFLYFYIIVFLVSYIFFNFGEIQAILVIMGCFMITLLVWLFILKTKTVPLFALWSVFLFSFFVIHLLLTYYF